MQVESRIASLWQQRMGRLKEYDVVRDGNVFGAGLSGNCVFSSEYEKTRAMLNRLLEQHEGVSFDTVFAGRETENEGGSCPVLESHHVIPPVSFDSGRLEQDMLSDLTLVRGIGPVSEHRLKSRGYQTIEDLAGHPKFRTVAKEVLDRLGQGDTADVIDLVGGRHAKSHRFVLGAAASIEPKNLVFLDIETLGLFSRPIILFGIGTMERGGIIVRQYLLRDVCDETAALVETARCFDPGKTALVTFNGKAFDLPYIQDRLAYYGFRAIPRIPHFDMLHFSRGRWKRELLSCRLSALESAILGIHRSDDLPGQMVPEFYETYLKTQNCGPLVPIVEHNRQDVISLARLFFYLVEENYGCF